MVKFHQEACYREVVVELIHWVVHREAVQKVVHSMVAVQKADR